MADGGGGALPGPRRRSLLARRALGWGLGWIFAAAFYLLLIDVTDLPELIVGAGAAMLAATGLELAREQAIVGESVRAGWLVRLYRAMLRVPSDVAIVSWMALRQLVAPRARCGTFRAVRFRCGEDQLESGRQALAEAAGSLAPNTLIVGADEQRQLLVAHQLRPTGGREAIDVLGLG